MPIASSAVLIGLGLADRRHMPARHALKSCSSQLKSFRVVMSKSCCTVSRSSMVTSTSITGETRHSGRKQIREPFTLRTAALFCDETVLLVGLTSSD